MGPKDGFLWDPFLFNRQSTAKVALILFLACIVTKNVKEMGKIKTLFKIMLMVLPVVGLVGASNLSTAIIILGIAVILIFVASPKYTQFIWMGCLDVDSLVFSSGWRAIVWNVLQSGEIRKSMRKVIKHCRDFMQSVPEDFLDGEWETVYRNSDLFRRHRMT